MGEVGSEGGGFCLCEGGWVVGTGLGDEPVRFFARVQKG